MPRFLHPVVVRYLNSVDEDARARFLDEFRKEAARDRVLSALVGMFAEGRDLGEQLLEVLSGLQNSLSGADEVPLRDLEEAGARWFTLSKRLRAMSLRVPRIYPSPLNELFVMAQNLVHGGTRDLDSLLVAVQAVAGTVEFNSLSGLLETFRVVATDSRRWEEFEGLLRELQERGHSFRDPLRQRWDHLRLRTSYLLEEIQAGLWMKELQSELDECAADLKDAVTAGNIEACLAILETLEQTLTEADELTSVRKSSNFHDLLRLMRGVYAGRAPNSYLFAELERIQSLKDSFEEILLTKEDGLGRVEQLAEDFELLECGLAEVRDFLQSGEREQLQSAYEQILVGVSGLLEQRTAGGQRKPLETLLCLHCGGENSVATRFCVGCGAALMRIVEEAPVSSQLNVLADEVVEGQGGTGLESLLVLLRSSQLSGPVEGRGRPELLDYLNKLRVFQRRVGLSAELREVLDELAGLLEGLLGKLHTSEVLEPEMSRLEELEATLRRKGTESSGPNFRQF